MNLLSWTQTKIKYNGYLVDSRWFKQWKKYVGFDSWDKYQMGDQNVYPGPVDNSGLLIDSDSQSLKEHLIDELDYILVPTEGWNKLVSWYGLLESHEPIARKVVEQGMFVKHCKVEVYLTELKLCENGNMNNVVTRRFSKADTIDSIEKEMRKLFTIPSEKEIRLWNKYMSNTFEPLNKPDSTIQDAGLYQGQVLVIEQKNEDGTWPRGPSTNKSPSASNFSTLPKVSPSSLSNNYNSFSNRNVKNSNYCIPSYSGYNNYDYLEPGRHSEQPGLCGLSNLGNTCFMNSAVQCLSNTSPLTEYFVSDEYMDELNNDNPLGMRGEIANAYADLIKQMWSGKYSYVTPRAFKTQVGRFAPQFSGYQQQDSQELLAFLLDGLHEDLNRIRKKPYIQLKDAEGRPDEVVAKEAWENHRKRNDSIIVDIFHGLFKSTLVCPECSKVSVTFDPFCYLTLPLPLRKERTLEVFLVRMDPLTKPMQYKVVVPKIGIISDLCAALSTLSGLPADKMVVTDIYNHRFHRIFSMDENLSSIMERDDIFIFEVSGSRTDDTDNVVIPVYLREKYRQPSYSHHSSSCLFGQPFMISVPRNITEEKLYNLLLMKMCRYVRTPNENEDEEATLHFAKDHGINGNEQNGVHEEGSPSEMETDEQDDESSQDQELPSENENSQSEESVGGDNDDSENGICTDDTCKGHLFQGHKKQLFTFQFNNLGNADINYVKDDSRQIRFEDSRQIRLDERTYLALDWDPEVKKRCFDENAAEDFEKHESMEYRPQKKMFVKLKDSIELFTTKEKLGAEDPWYCPNCKQHQQATKKLDLWSLPPVLVVHLKRFSYSRYWRDKLDTLVDFPISALDMSEFLINPNAGPCEYNLIAVSNHYGGMGGGHYTAFAKNKDDDKWYYFDDTSVSPATEDQIVSKAAYVLFYQRQDTVSGTGYFAHDRIVKKEASAAVGARVESDEDCNENDVENENCMHTN
ncbi:ubiquitin carboxyl-terminal hydrolase 15 isoform X2 [Callorhinchus milii]|uniref:Ubiquitin carboxyl-terminal hydrolase n=1 Tax=Callorhinchus milii TaxID=7868 RepID=A0A4W3HM16_CALMI|nr:ubiquitin carboxyl-terminal hydrolase 15 isoform X2 [Callorhinchus milii]|eukprot:gi/632955407/ref/XP_007893450.1/ PREDICTED: ubiquitin carboxyl-terminal hydrolase 15 isoform X2 [Callorhinchus milii]